MKQGEESTSDLFVETFFMISYCVNYYCNDVLFVFTTNFE